MVPALIRHPTTSRTAQLSIPEDLETPKEAVEGSTLEVTQSVHNTQTTQALSLNLVYAFIVPGKVTFISFGKLIITCTRNQNVYSLRYLDPGNKVLFITKPWVLSS